MASQLEDPTKDQHLTVNPFERRCRSLKQKYEGSLWAVSIATLLIGAIAGMIGAHWLILGPRVDDAVKKQVLSQGVLEQIALRLRPYAVFDTYLNKPSTVVEYDQGAGDLVDTVEFNKGPDKTRGILFVKLRKFTPVAPLVQPLTADIHVFSFWRTNKFDWAYEIQSGWVTAVTDGVPNGYIPELSEGKQYRFLVELLTKDVNSP